MKALFLVFHGFEAYNAGISKKIFAQKQALSDCGLDTKLCYLQIDKEGYHKRMIDDQILENYGQGTAAKIKKRFSYWALTQYMLREQIRFLYIRSFHNANPFLIHMLKIIKRAGVKIVLEIPTYPYDQEYLEVSFSDKIRILTDRFFRHRMTGYIDRIVTFSNEKVIFGIPAINISNGIDFSTIKMKSLCPSNKHIRLIGVAEIHFWHGFDRVLTGLAQYYKEKHETNVYFDIVGDGVPEEMNKLRSIVSTEKLDSYVTFHGTKSGAELDELFEQADMGIASLGRHRSNITYIKPLKNREYAARGIPFVYSEIDDDFEQMPYIIKAPADETPLDIKKIIDFFHSRKFAPSEIRQSISGSLSWKVQMGKILRAVQTEMKK